MISTDNDKILNNTKRIFVKIDLLMVKVKFIQELM